MPTQDHALLAAMAQNDDRRALEKLFLRYKSELMAYALRLLGDAALAEEVVSDVFLKVWRLRQQLALQRSLRSYLYAATRHRAIDHLRQRLRRPYATDWSNAPLPSAPSPEEEAIYQETARHLERAISTLPPQGQNIFRLSRDEGLKYREIADRLDISIKTVETHMRRALISLRQEMAPYLS